MAMVVTCPHALCAVQSGLRDSAPCCAHCRDPWPSVEAGGGREQACRENNVLPVQNWQPLPVADEVEEPLGCQQSPMT